MTVSQRCRRRGPSGARRSAFGLQALFRGAVALACAAPMGCYEPEDPSVASVGTSSDGGSGSTSGAPSTSGDSLSGTQSDVSTGDPDTDTTLPTSGADGSTSDNATSDGCQTGVFGTAMFGAACFS